MKALAAAVVLTAGLVAPFPLVAQEALDPPDPTRHYVFYLHGRIIEDGDLRPTVPGWGLYDYPAVVEALGTRGAAVVSEARERATDIRVYAAKVRAQVEDLVRAGVPQAHITVVGFSKGAAIAIAVSAGMDPEFGDVRYVFLASCADWILEDPDVSLSGRVLAIFEASDETTSGCRGLAPHGLVGSSQIEINTGHSHGAFYVPRDAWLEPTLDWAHMAETQD